MTDCFVGIDTSNYTTSAAVCDVAGNVIANLKRPLPVKDGACGLRQSDAVFAHVKNLPSLMQDLSDLLKDHHVLAVGVSARPRDAEGSYMPCFLAGVSAAHALAAPLRIPVYELSHQNGHIMAAAYSSGQADRLLKGKFAAFHVSGGTTEVLAVTPSDRDFSVDMVGGTRDLNAGQVIDRVGVMMGLAFPCGRELERLAGENVRPLPRPRVKVEDGFCNLSGLENIARKLWEETGDRSFVSAYVLSCIGETLRLLTAQLDERCGALPIVYAGGVMSNHYLQAVLSARPDTCFAEPQFSADNAAGVALLCRKRYLNL